MKTSLRKLRGFALHQRHGGAAGDRRDLRPLAQPDELARASQDMQEIKDCYDSLLSASAATANSAYEFSESLREMGACLLEKTALNDDEESGKVLLMLGKVQYELQKLVDGYRSYIFQTITAPSESLLNELYTVEEMKRQCDEKREAYEYMVTRYREKGKGRSGKGDSFSLQQLQAAHEEYDEEATLFVFRLKSLKQGQSRSLLTQAARHHAAQSWFFKSALKSLEAVEPHVKKVAEQQHIDYHLSGLEHDYADDGNDGYDDDGDDVITDDDGELSFDYGQNDQDGEVSTSRNLMDLDPVDITFPRVETLGTVKQEMLDRGSRKSFTYRDENRTISQSAPLFPDTKFDSADKFKQMRPSLTRKFNTYVLPTPDDTKNSKSTESSNPVPPSLNPSVSDRNQILWHSTPLDPKTYQKVLGGQKLPESSTVAKRQPQRESSGDTLSSLLPPPLSDGILFRKSDILDTSDSKKLKRYAFSGPITPKAWPNHSATMERPQLFSGPILQNPMAQSPPKISPKVSPKGSRSASPTFVSSPKISELHELPRPPANSSSKLSRPMGLVGYSAPLGPKGHLFASVSKPLMSTAAAPLPIPSQAITRSFSIPSSGLRAMALNVSKPPKANHKQQKSEDVSSPPLTPISLPTSQPPSTAPED